MKETKRYNPKRFNYISFQGDVAHCSSHNFLFNPVEEEEKLYNAQPCIYTDVRYKTSFQNYYKETYLFHSRKFDVSFKSALRRIRRCKNVPNGTIAELSTKYVAPRVKLIVKNSDTFDPEYQINDPKFFDNFRYDKWAKDLTERLREEGFIVKIFDDDHYVYDLKGNTVNRIHQSAVAYGYGKKIGFSSFKNPFYGYNNGRNNILWDRFDEFNKWSQCNEISKETDIEEVIFKLAYEQGNSNEESSTTT